MKTLIISSEELHDIRKIVKSLEEAGLLINGVSEPVENQLNDQKGQLLGILVATLVYFIRKYAST